MDFRLQRLAKQLEDLNVPFVDDFPSALKSTDHVVDAIFGSCISLNRSSSKPLTILATGFSFSGEVREPFPAVIQALEETRIPVTAVDAPSSWDIEEGPPKSGVGSNFHPAVLVSLTAPKPLVNFFKGRHFIGGRFAPVSCGLDSAALLTVW
jgi:NAD(P)H-hydrate epimerase